MWKLSPLTKRLIPCIKSSKYSLHADPLNGEQTNLFEESD